MTTSQVEEYINHYIPKGLSGYLWAFVYGDYKFTHYQKTKRLFKQLMRRTEKVLEQMDDEENVDWSQHHKDDSHDCTYSWNYSHETYGRYNNWQLIQTCESCRHFCESNQYLLETISEVRLKRYLGHHTSEWKGYVLRELEDDFDKIIDDLVPTSSYKCKWERPKRKQFIWKHKRAYSVYNDHPNLVTCSGYADIKDIDFCKKARR
jgi:hypothetical protein